MPVWKESKGWRYRFQYVGVKYNRAWFKTKAEARAAEAVHKAALRQATTAKTRIGMVFSELANEYLDYATRQFAVKTYKYKSYVFRSFMAVVGDIPVSQISISLLESYLRTRHSNTNYNRHRKDLCALFAWGWKRRYLSENPCHFLEKLREDRQQRVIPTPEEMQRLLLAAGENRPFILTLYHTLGRIDEVLRLRWSDINFQDRMITIWTRKRKGGEWASDVMAMNQVLYDTLWNLWQTRTQDEWVFFNRKTGTRYHHRPKLMRRVCKTAGIRHFGFHSIRHYVASLLHDTKKVSLSQVSKLLRHQSKATTERYLQVIDPGSREAMAALESEFMQHLPLAPSHENI